MKNRKTFLAKVFSYSLIAFHTVFTFSVLPGFLADSDNLRALLLLAFLAVTFLILFVFPNLLKIMPNVSYRFNAIIVFALCVIFSSVAIPRMNFLLKGYSQRPSNYVIVIGMGLFVVINLAALLRFMRRDDVDQGDIVV